MIILSDLKITATEIKNIGQIISALINQYEICPRKDKEDIFDLLSKLLEERTDKLLGNVYEADWDNKHTDIETCLEMLARELKCLGQITADLVSYYETFPVNNQKEIFNLLNTLTKERSDTLVKLACKGQNN